MKYTLSRRGSFVTPHGIIRADRDGRYHLTDAQRDHLEREFGVIATPADDVAVPDVVDLVAQANIEANRAAAAALEHEQSAIPIPKARRTRRR